MAQKTIYLAGGCFWGVSEYYSRIKGVVSTVTGYAQSNLDNPSYEQVKTGTTDAAETVEVVFDDNVVSLKTLLRQFFKIIDPVSLNRQGLDKGTQYRTGIFYLDEQDRNTIDEIISEEQLKYEDKIVTQNLKLKNFYKAEEYHQDYLKKNPGGYCHTDFSSLKDLDDEAREFIDPAKYRLKSRAELLEQLSTESYEITQHAATEAPFSGEYNNNFAKGLYVDIITGSPLFTSEDKFHSDCGWPAFAKPVNETVLSRHEDHSLNRERIEVKSKTSHGHLGHVFNDGPKELGGLRYCINSKALRFIPYADLDDEGYGEFKKLFREAE